MTSGVVILDRHPYFRGALAAILGILALIIVYLLIAWRFPSLLSDPDHFLNKYGRQVPVQIEHSLQQQAQDVKDWKPAIHYERTDTEWKPDAFEWRGYTLPLPDPAYPIYYSKTDGLIYVHRQDDSLQVLTMSHDGRLARGPAFTSIPFFGTNKGGVRPLHQDAQETHIVEGEGSPLYVGENPREAYVIEGVRKFGPYDTIDGIPAPGASEGASPLFLARKGGQCLVVIGDQSYTF
jgi:hypothetical protein